MAKGVPAGAAAPLLGDLLIVGAQVLQATQFILEEKYLSQACFFGSIMQYPKNQYSEG